MYHPYKINKYYRDNDILRKSFNELAKDTFCLDFEDWYQNGYWKDNYIPYSVTDNDRVVANASVNIMDFFYLQMTVSLISIQNSASEKA